MKKVIPVFLLILLSHFVFAQNSNTDSLKKLLSASKADTNRVILLGKLFQAYQSSNPDAAMMFIRRGLKLSRNLQYRKGEADCLNRIGLMFWQTGNYSKALETHFQSLKIKEEINNQPGIFNSLNNIGIVYAEHGEKRDALNYLFKAKKIAENLKDDRKLGICLSNIGAAYRDLNLLDSALIYEQDAYQLMLETRDMDNISGVLSILGVIHFKMGNIPLALEYYRLSIPYSLKAGDKSGLTDTYIHLAELFKTTGPIDSCIYYAEKAISVAKAISYPRAIIDAGILLSDVYKGKDERLEYYYYRMAMTAKDNLFSADRIKQIENLSFNEKIRQQEIADQKYQDQINRKVNLQVAGIAIFIPLFFVLLLLLSKIHIKRRIVETMSVISIVLLFEFIALLIHPTIEKITNHSPVFMLVILVAVAGALAPLHHALADLIKEKVKDVKEAKELEAKLKD